MSLSVSDMETQKVEILRACGLCFMGFVTTFRCHNTKMSKSKGHREHFLPLSFSHMYSHSVPICWTGNPSLTFIEFGFQYDMLFFISVRFNLVRLPSQRRLTFCSNPLDRIHRRLQLIIDYPDNSLFRQLDIRLLFIVY